MILFIDTSGDEVALALVDGKVRRFKFFGSHVSEKLLPNIKKLLKRNQLRLEKLKKIVVVTGPGPFSRIRTGVVTANTLAYALNIPVVGIKGLSSPLIYQHLIADKSAGYKFIKPVLPYYASPPHITKAKKHV